MLCLRHPRQKVPMNLRLTALLAVPLLIAAPLAMPANDGDGGTARWVGGQENPATVPAGTVGVKTWEQLRRAVQAGEPTVYIETSAVIDVPNQSNALRLQPHQRLIGARSATSAGPLLRTPFKGGINDYPVITMASGAVLEGVRLAGPNAGPSTQNKTIGIQTLPGSSGQTISNNEIYGWSWAAVSLKRTHDARVDQNYIHHNLREHLGYGVVVQNGDTSAKIRGNVFDANRHAIAGSGAAGEEYEATENLVLQGGGEAAYHQFDMHERGGIGGKRVRIAGNIFDYGRPGTTNRSSILIRGVPTDGRADIIANVFTQPWNVGRQEAVEGKPGSILPEHRLRSLNVFDSPIQYVIAAEGCTVRVPTRTFRAPCAALNPVSTGLPRLDSIPGLPQR